MTRRQALTLSLLGLAPGGASALAQSGVGVSRTSLPGRAVLARLGLERGWYAMVPFGFGTERLLSLNLAEDLIFAQTTHANLHVYDAETGRYRWGVNLGEGSRDARPVSVNSDMAFVTNGRSMIALDRGTGRTVWTAKMEGSAIGATAATEERVMVGLANGKLVAFNVRDRTKADPPGRSAGTFAWTWQARGPIVARPIPAGKVVAFASEDSRVYVAADDPKTILWRYLTGGPITGSMSTHDTRTLIVPSTDGILYGIDLFTGETKWRMSTGAPLDREPVVEGDRVLAINRAGRVIIVDAVTGELLRAADTGARRFVAISQTRAYVQTTDNDLAIVDRTTGRVTSTPRDTRDRAGLDLRDHTLSFTNRLNDRMYFATPSGLVLCLREAGQAVPRSLRDPKAPPFGYLPPGGEPQTPPPPPPEEGEAGAAPAEGEAKPEDK